MSRAGRIPMDASTNAMLGMGERFKQAQDRRRKQTFQYKDEGGAMKDMGPVFGVKICNPHDGRAVRGTFEYELDGRLYPSTKDTNGDAMIRVVDRDYFSDKIAYNRGWRKYYIDVYKDVMEMDNNTLDVFFGTPGMSTNFTQQGIHPVQILAAEGTPQHGQKVMQMYDIIKQYAPAYNRKPIDEQGNTQIVDEGIVVENDFQGVGGDGEVV
jgi:hypothetical protein